MQALNLALFQWIGAGASPHPQLLAFAAAVAVAAAWVGIATMAWTAWRHPAQRAYSLATLIAAAVASVAAHAIAEHLAMPRPFAVGLGAAHIQHGDRGGMPSTHAAVMFTVALMYMMRAPLRRVGLVLFALALLTGWARIHVGVHFPLDVAGGLLLAIGVAAGFRGLEAGIRRWIVPVVARDTARTSAARMLPPS